MLSQLLPISKYNLYHSQSNQHYKPAFYPKSKSGFFNSAKRVSVSTISSLKSGQMTIIACAGQHTTHEQEKEVMLDDGYYMRRCVELAKKAIGCTSPNPMVGCVIVNDGKIVGEGFHPKAGQPHAEVFALRDAGDLAENGTAYVSLEPCNHYGRTPPCSEALIKAKVRKVVVGMVDPNPVVDSTGIKKLQDAGIEVTVGVEEEMCKKLNEAFIHRMLTGKPFVTLRYSISLDGHFLNQLGEEALESGGYYSKLLQEYDAVLLSSASIAEKSSLPLSKEPGANQPLKIVVSKSPDSLIQIPTLDIDPDSKMVIISEKTTGIDTPEIVREDVQRLYFDRISLLEILEQCKHQGMCNVLLDLTGNLVDFEDILNEGFEQNLFQKVIVEVLPVFGGGRERVPSFVDLKSEMKKLTSRVSGQSVILEGYF